jgi:hypothetical protein
MQLRIIYGGSVLKPYRSAGLEYVAPSLCRNHAYTMLKHRRGSFVMKLAGVFGT